MDLFLSSCPWDLRIHPLDRTEKNNFSMQATALAPTPVIVAAAAEEWVWVDDESPIEAGNLFSQDGSLNFDSSVSSLKPLSCSDSAHASLTTSASDITSHCDSGSGGVIPSAHWLPERSRGLPPLFGLLLSKRSKELEIFQNIPSGNVIFPVVCVEGGNCVIYLSYPDSEIDAVHAAFSVTIATHDSGGRKCGDQTHVSFPVGVRGINQFTLIK